MEFVVVCLCVASWSGDGFNFVGLEPCGDHVSCSTNGVGSVIPICWLDLWQCGWILVII
jgi:hypothetical protein